jgi:hypothetical protein
VNWIVQRQLDAVAEHLEMRIYHQERGISPAANAATPLLSVTMPGGSQVAAWVETSTSILVGPCWQHCVEL